MSNWADLSGFQRDLLLTIYEVESEDDVEPYGLELRSRLNDKYEDTIRHSRLYPNLDRLADKGLTEREELDKRTKANRLTDDARDLIEGHAAEMKHLVPDAPLLADGGNDE